MLLFSYALLWFFVILAHFCTIHSAPPVKQRVELALTQMSEIVIKMDQFLATKCKFEKEKIMSKMSEKIKEEKYGQIIGQLKQLRLSELQRYKETKGELSQQTEEFIKIILAHWVGSLAAIKREIRPSELNKELAKLNEPKDNLIVMEKLFDLAWFMCAKLKHSEKRHEFARSKTWRMIEWHYYEELEWKLCKTRDLIRKTLVTEFQVPNSFALTIDLPFHLEMVWFGPPAENIAGWVLKDGPSNSESSSSKNGEIIDNGGNKKPKKKQKIK